MYTNHLQGSIRGNEDQSECHTGGIRIERHCEKGRLLSSRGQFYCTGTLTIVFYKSIVQFIILNIIIFSIYLK